MVVERKTLSSGRREKSEKSGIKPPHGERKRNEDIFHEVFKKGEEGNVERKESEVNVEWRWQTMIEWCGVKSIDLKYFLSSYS